MRGQIADPHLVNKARAGLADERARALGGMIDLIRKGTFTRDENILFWHTGGDAELHAYSREFTS